MTNEEIKKVITLYGKLKAALTEEEFQEFMNYVRKDLDKIAEDGERHDQLLNDLESDIARFCEEETEFIEGLGKAKE